MPAYRAAPAGKTGLPVVLVLSETFGVHEYIADTAHRFAKAGHLAIAPELFVRQGDVQSYGEMAKLIAEAMSKVPDAQIMADLDAGMKWAAANGGDAAAKASKFVVYPDVPRAFHADYRASCRKEAADEGWKRALEWIKAQGVA